VTFADIVPGLKASMPSLRGRLLANQSLAEFTWFRVGGAAQVLFVPEDEADLAYFLAALPSEIPVTVVGLGSNLIVRDGGVPGIVIRLGRGFADVRIEPDSCIRVAGGGDRGLCVFSRHPGSDRWCAAHEWRRIWAGDKRYRHRGERR